MKAELRKEYEAIRSRTISGLCDPANKVTVGTVIDAVCEAVTACQALADRPPKELTDADIDAISEKYFPDSATEWRLRERQAARDVIAAHIAKQREPETMKFRAARLKPLDDIQVLRLSDGMELGEDWEWLEPAQEFEVRI